jgi:hypothetical protein
MLAPGTPQDPIQVIDVRDLSAWMLRMLNTRTTGYFNADSAPRAFTMGDLITASQQASPQAGTPSPGCQRHSSPRTGSPKSSICHPGPPSRVIRRP